MAMVAPTPRPKPFISPHLMPPQHLAFLEQRSMPTAPTAARPFSATSPINRRALGMSPTGTGPSETAILLFYKTQTIHS
jgi:hypothetical protein